MVRILPRQHSDRYFPSGFDQYVKPEASHLAVQSENERPRSDKTLRCAINRSDWTNDHRSGIVMSRSSSTWRVERPVYIPGAMETPGGWSIPQSPPITPALGTNLGDTVAVHLHDDSTAEGLERDRVWESNFHTRGSCSTSMSGTPRRERWNLKDA